MTKINKKILNYYTYNENTRAVGVCIDDVKNLDRGRFRTRVVDLKELGGRRS